MNSLGWALIPLVSLQEETRTQTRGRPREETASARPGEAAGKQSWDTGGSGCGLQAAGGSVLFDLRPCTCPGPRNQPHTHLLSNSTERCASGHRPGLGPLPVRRPCPCHEEVQRRLPGTKARSHHCEEEGMPVTLANNWL